MRPRGADVVVVGVGLSGLEFAAELVSCGVRDVVVLEAGPALPDDHSDLDLMAGWLRPGADCVRSPHHRPAGAARPQIPEAGIVGAVEGVPSR